MGSTGEKKITCKNCGNHFSGNYCNKCGQQADTDRLTFKETLHHFLHAFTHMDKGFFNTAKEMIVRPGHAAREYLQGKRVSHANPFLMLLIIGGISSLLYYKFDIASANSIKISELQGSLQVLASKFFAVLFILYCFLFALIDRIFFNYKHYYYSELFVFNVFLAVEVMILNICLVPVWILFGSSLAGDYFRVLVFLVVISYFMIARYQFFEVANDKKARSRLLLEFLVLLVIVGSGGWKTFSNILSGI